MKAHICSFILVVLTSGVTFAQDKGKTPPAPAKSGGPPPPPLNDTTYKTIADHIRPSAADTRWEEIPWRLSFNAAFIEAARLQKPILLWSMQGDPLGCT